MLDRNVKLRGRFVYDEAEMLVPVTERVAKKD